MKHYYREVQNGNAKYYYVTQEGSIEITEEIYNVNRSSNRKERYQKKKLAQNNVISLNAYAGEENSLTTLVVQTENMEETIINKIIVRESVRNLKPLLRKVILYHYWYGYSCKEIGLILNLPLRTVYNYLNRALTILKSDLNEKNSGGNQA